MIYVKSVLAGLVALVVVTICLFVILVIVMLIYASLHHSTGEGSIGWDPVSLFRLNPVTWFAPVVIFLAGFFWEYRRLAK